MRNSLHTPDLLFPLTLIRSNPSTTQFPRYRLFCLARNRQRRAFHIRGKSQSRAGRLPPGATLTQPYSPGSGLFAFGWLSSAPVGFVNSGTFVLNAEWWTGDPFADGEFIALADEQVAPCSAQVSPPADVPEPATFLLLCAGLAALIKRKQKLI